MKSVYYIENGLQIVGPNGATGYFIVVDHIFGPGGSRTGYWINEVNRHIVRPDGADAGLWLDDEDRIFGQGHAPWMA